MPKTSRYALIVDNISSSTPVREIESYDAQAAWRKMDGVRMDGRTWKVDWATREDFRFFGWKWFEYSPSPVRSRSLSRGRSRSPSRGRTPPRGRSPSHSPRRSRSRSPNTPRGKDDRPRDASKSTSPPPRREDGKQAATQDRGRSPSPRRD
ncbi:hypothetical protein GPECTOR_11g149 [Gonium pectorale]|uniref:Uncharacterized protein n=1 Tax=Gonium pectorale TaxID=33097 RepID=A0A150GPD2_GONPE|nr:hypothetical protein GPECTOR_11g149 [Gonium pectorale]|eukprot:KXZ51699.1 hypothetical protein GPECTOR_11g149 [Gonium pectorale]